MNKLCLYSEQIGAEIAEQFVFHPCHVFTKPAPWRGENLSLIVELSPSIYVDSYTRIIAVLNIRTSLMYSNTFYRARLFETQIICVQKKCLMPVSNTCPSSTEIEPRPIRLVTYGTRRNTAAPLPRNAGPNK
jgi:hypothetical protein